LGYKHASKEYSAAFKYIKKEYEIAKNKYEENKKSLYDESEKLLTLQKDLEKKREHLEKEINNKAKEVSNTVGVSLSSVTRALSSESILTDGCLGEPSLLGIIWNIKKKKMIKYEKIGYEKAKEEYDKKISILKRELNELNERSSIETSQMNNLINMLMLKIIEDRTKIAELKITLELING
jgi:tetratricopeptide (TPR) repeat protein